MTGPRGVIASLILVASLTAAPTGAGIAGASMLRSLPDPGGAAIQQARSSKTDRIAVYRGLGTWIDMYDREPWAAPTSAVEEMAGRGVQTLYLQTSNYTKKRALFRPRALARFLDAAHARNIEVVAWYVPSFKNLKRDMKRIRAAISFATPAGERFDSFALDIEATTVRDISTRNRRTITLSTRIRRFVGPGYTLGAIVPEARAAYWPAFPYSGLAPRYDVFLPMAYFTYRVNGARAVRAWTAENMRVLKTATGKPVHAIGGIAGRASGREVRTFLDTVVAHNAIGTSLYDFPLTTTSEWRLLGSAAARISK